ncbi:MAG: SprT family zinc-dependent metalloprotease [Leptospira sp.]|nr:SprT family zinc-dependent metalloprotease [Leptospira sp.]
MSEIFTFDDIIVEVTFKEVKNVHLNVHPPDGRVTLVAPTATRLDVARAYAISRLAWIRKQRQGFKDQARETPREFIKRETHYLWGRQYLLDVIEKDGTPKVTIDHRSITLYIRPGSPIEKKSEVIHNWHKRLLHEALPQLIKKWEEKLGVTVSSYFLQKMKTKWGSCNYNEKNIRINTELIKKPKDLLEYIVVHEMIHLLEPSHNERFIHLMNQHIPSWREARKELNEIPLSAVDWKK